MCVVREVRNVRSGSRRTRRGVGASMAGMLAARVAAEHYRLVTVVDRDELLKRCRCAGAVCRSRRNHVLQAAGTAVLEELLPGIGDGSPPPACRCGATATGRG